MRFLIDENVQFKLLNWLISQGHDAVRVPAGTKNGSVIALGLSEKRILITHDHDFADRLRYPPAKHAGIILIEIHPPLLNDLRDALSKLLQNPPPDFSAHLIVLQQKGYHIFP